jgi:hypothetical protein
VFAETMFHPELFESIRDKIFPGVVEATQRVFNSEVENGTFRKVDSFAAMKVFLGMIFVHTMMKEMSSEIHDSKDDEGAVRCMIDIFLNGVRIGETPASLK